MNKDFKSEIENQKWYSSKETAKILKLKDCELMHYRLKGEIKFKKEGNRYLYLLKNSINQ